MAGKQPSKAVEKHVANHGDLETYVESGEGEVCKPGGTGAVACHTVTLCEEADILITWH